MTVKSIATFSRSGKRVVFLMLGILCCVWVGGCASPNKDGVSALDVSERQSANYGSGDKSQDRTADSNNVNLFKMKTSF